MTETALPGVSFVVPVYDGERHLPPLLGAILAQRDGRPFEAIFVDDRSRDGSRAILDRWAADHPGTVRVIDGEGRGAAAAIAAGLAAARYPLVAQVDQDVRPDPGWLAAATAGFSDPALAAVHGRYRPEEGATCWARVASLDYSLRFDAAAAGGGADHAGSGNSVWRREAILSVGGPDPTLGYGYDNDLSYRLVAAGWRLGYAPAATAVHAWRETLGGYLAQQYGVGYGRLDVIARHPGKATGDRFSGLRMILHVPLLAAAVVAIGLGGAIPSARPAAPAVAAFLVGLLLGDRVVAAVEAFCRFRDPAAFLFPAAHLLRDGVWLAATLAWGFRRLAGHRGGAAASMPR